MQRQVRNSFTVTHKGQQFKGPCAIDLTAEEAKAWEHILEPLPEPSAEAPSLPPAEDVKVEPVKAKTTKKH